MKIHWFVLLISAGAVFGQGGATYQGMNPNIGVIGDFLFRNHLNDNEEKGSGFEFREVELSFRMVMDPYARADVYMAVVPPEEAVELEEGFITLLALPFSTQAKIGHFRNAFGKFNLTHPPETPLVTTPLFLKNYFGEEGLAETGISLSALLPNPWEFYLEATVDVLNPDNEVSFSGGASQKLLYLLHLKSFFDITEENSLEVGFSAMSGPNDSTGVHKTGLYGADAIYRFKPLALGRYRSLTVQWEALYSQRESDEGTVNSYAAFLFCQYQLSRRWFAGFSYDYAGFEDSSQGTEQRFSGLVTFWPSEFQTVKLQIQQTERNLSSRQRLKSVWFQWTFIIGAHGAHKY